jgi:adenine-specific DNA-methyltransferase
MLKLYGAEPVAGLAHSQGRKQDALVHVGPVDAPVTTQEIDAAVDECAKLQRRALHVLGWSWEGERCDVMAQVAATKGVKLLLLQIPREVMEQQAAGILFSPLACFDAEIEQPGSLAAQVVLRNFMIPNAELLPEDGRCRVEKWPDYIDYWAVDWDGCDETIAQGWAAYRTRKQKDLSLVSDLHRYEKAGKHRILVQVIDIFGNATRQAFDVDIQQP